MKKKLRNYYVIHNIIPRDILINNLDGFEMFPMLYTLRK